jgi:DNA adenine methylase
MSRYIEPFAGSACLFFALRPERAILGDINHELLTTYETICEHPRLVHRLASSYETTDKQYYLLRQLEPSSLGLIERAARFVYLNRYCFNGIYRTNKKGAFNVPRGIKTGAIQEEKLFYRCSVALRRVTFIKGDFADCLADLSEGDFVYIDPPYMVPGKRQSGEYGYKSFEFSDVERLVTQLKIVANKNVKFLLSYLKCDELLELLPRDWRTQTLIVRRHVAGFAQHRKFVSEILVTNP